MRSSKLPVDISVMTLANLRLTESTKVLTMSSNSRLRRFAGARDGAGPGGAADRAPAPQRRGGRPPRRTTCGCSLALGLDGALYRERLPAAPLLRVPRGGRALRGIPPHSCADHAQPPP